MGLITKHHNQENAEYHWFKDEEEIVSGTNKSIISVKQPGTYSAGVQIGEVLYLSEPRIDVTLPKPVLLPAHTPPMIDGDVSIVVPTSLSITTNLEVPREVSLPEPISYILVYKH